MTVTGMADLIDRDALMADIATSLVFSGRTSRNAEMRGANKIIDRIKAAPTVDVAPVRHGRWIRRKSCHTQTGFIDRCSVCQKDLVHLGYKTNFCPNCGAKMDLEVDT